MQQGVDVGMDDLPMLGDAGIVVVAGLDGSVSEEQSFTVNITATLEDTSYAKYIRIYDGINTSGRLLFEKTSDFHEGEINLGTYEIRSSHVYFDAMGNGAYLNLISGTSAGIGESMRLPSGGYLSRSGCSDVEATASGDINIHIYFDI